MKDFLVRIMFHVIVVAVLLTHKHSIEEQVRQASERCYLWLFAFGSVDWCRFESTLFRQPADGLFYRLSVGDKEEEK